MMLRLDWSKAHLATVKLQAIIRWTMFPERYRRTVALLWFMYISNRMLERKVEVVDPDEYIPPGARWHDRPIAT